MGVKDLILENIYNYRFLNVQIRFEDKKEEVLDLVKRNISLGQKSQEKFLFKLEDLDEKTKSNFVFLLRNLDFSLWKCPQNWQYRGEKDFFALSERLKDLFWVDKVDFEKFKKIISPKEDLKLAKLRYKIYRSALKFLEKYHHNFFNYFKENKNSLDFCLNLWELKKFQDKYKNLYFLKPNQLLYYEFLLSHNLDKKYLSELKNLTVFADYKLIQLFLNWGLIVLRPRELKKIKNKKIIKSQSVLENELRLATILMGEQISQQTKLPSYLLDGILWDLSHKIKLQIPYPRVLTIFY